MPAVGPAAASRPPSMRGQWASHELRTIRACGISCQRRVQRRYYTGDHITHVGLTFVALRDHHTGECPEPQRAPEFWKPLSFPTYDWPGVVR